MFRSLLKFAPVQAFSSLSVFFLIAIQTRFLTVKEYGLLALFLVLIEVFRAFVSQWLSTSMLRLYPASSYETKRLQAATTLKLIYGLWLPACGALALCLLSYDAFEVSTLGALAGLLLTKSIYLYFIDPARLDERASYYRKAVMTQSLLALVISILFLTFNNTADFAIYALTASYLIGGLWVYKKESEVSFDKDTAITFVRYGGPLLLVGLLSVIGTRIDRFFIADQLGLTETGVYSAVSGMLLGVMALVFMVVAMPLYPELTKLTNQSLELKKRHAQYFDLLMAITLPSLIGLCFLSTSLINIFLSDNYSDGSGDIFYILATSAFLLNLKGHYIDHGLQFSLKTKYLTVVSIFMMIINLVLLFALVEPLGLRGAAWASLLTNFGAVILTFLLAKNKDYNYSFGENFFKVVAASFLMAISLKFSNLFFKTESSLSEIIFKIIVGGLTYSVAILSMNAFNMRKQLLKGSSE